MARQRSVWFGLCLALAMSAAPAWCAEPYSIEPATAKASAYLPQSLVDGVDPQGTRLFTYVNGLKMPISEIFWARNVMQQEAPARPGKILYGNLKPGALLGVIHFFADTNEEYREDFHDHKLRPGYYTMRYSAMPDEERAHDSNPRDFVLLSPVSVDRDPARVVPLEELTRHSRIASRSKEPAVMSLVAVETTRKYPSVQTDDSGMCIMQVKVHATPEKGGSPQELALAMVVVTPILENGAS